MVAVAQLYAGEHRMKKYLAKSLLWVIAAVLAVMTFTGGLLTWEVVEKIFNYPKSPVAAVATLLILSVIGIIISARRITDDIGAGGAVSQRLLKLVGTCVVMVGLVTAAFMVRMPTPTALLWAFMSTLLFFVPVTAIYASYVMWQRGFKWLAGKVPHPQKPAH